MKKTGIVVILLASVAFVAAQNWQPGPYYNGGDISGNLKIGSKYISGDGDNEGISVSSAGAVTVSGALTPASLTTPGAVTIGGALVVTGNVTTAAGTVSAEQLTSTDDITAAAGTVSAEQLTSTDDITGAGALTMTDAAAESSFLGNVGIGTNNPAQLLHVMSTGAGTIKVSGGAASLFPIIQLDDEETGGEVWNIENGREGDAIFGVYDSGSTGGTGTRFQMDSSGRPAFGALGALNYGSQADAVAAGVVTNGLYHTNGVVKVVY